VPCIEDIWLYLRLPFKCLVVMIGSCDLLNTVTVELGKLARAIVSIRIQVLCFVLLGVPRILESMAERS
jgi:hypothetical protein